MKQENGWLLGGVFAFHTPPMPKREEARMETIHPTVAGSTVMFQTLSGAR